MRKFNLRATFLVIMTLLLISLGVVYATFHYVVNCVEDFKVLLDDEKKFTNNTFIVFDPNGLKFDDDSSDIIKIRVPIGGTLGNRIPDTPSKSSYLHQIENFQIDGWAIKNNLTGFYESINENSIIEKETIVVPKLVGLNEEIATIGKLEYKFLSVQDTEYFECVLNGFSVGYKQTQNKLDGILENIDGFVINKINERAFENEKTLTQVVLSDMINELGVRSFSKTGLKSFNFNNIHKIDSEAFLECGELSSDIYLPKIRVLGQMIFGSTPKLIGKLRFSTDVEFNHIPLNAFAETAFTDILIPGNVKTIGAQAFFNMNEKREGLFGTILLIEEGVEEIGDLAFLSSGFTCDLVIPKSMEKIGNYAFSSLNFDETGSGFKNLIFSEPHEAKLTFIGDYAFYRFGVLDGNTIVFPAGLKRIEIMAFVGFQNCIFDLSLTNYDDFISWGDNWYSQIVPIIPPTEGEGL